MWGLWVAWKAVSPKFVDNSNMVCSTSLVPPAAFNMDDSVQIFLDLILDRNNIGLSDP